MSIYTLENLDSCVRGVFSSKEELSKGVDYWVREFPCETLSWIKWEMNQLDPRGWSYAYISSNDAEQLKAKSIEPDLWQDLWIVGENLVVEENDFESF